MVRADPDTAAGRAALTSVGGGAQQSPPGPPLPTGGADRAQAAPSLWPEALVTQRGLHEVMKLKAAASPLRIVFPIYEAQRSPGADSSELGCPFPWAVSGQQRGRLSHEKRSGC